MNIAYFITENTKDASIWLLKKYYENDNFFTVANDIRHTNIAEIASVNMYYVNFMEGKIIFDSINDFVLFYENKNMLPKPILFLEKIDTNNKNDIVHYLQKFETILTIKNNKIESINYETL